MTATQASAVPVRPVPAATRDFHALMLGALPDVDKRVSSGDAIGR